MAGNKELIDEIVSPEAVKQVADLKKYIDELEVSFVKLAKAATAANNATGSSASGGGFTKTVAESNKATKALVDNAEKTRLAEIKLQQAREKAFDTFERNLAKQNANIEKTSGAYYKLEQAYNAVNKEAKNAAVQFGQTSFQFKQAQEQALGLRKRLDEIDQPLGNYGRNVGNYAGKFNGLSNSINQLTREAPAFAVSVQTGFLALSNNLPIFFDQIKQTKDEVAALRAEGIKTPGVLSRLASSFFSVGTVLSVGVTLLTIYGAEIIKFASSVFKGTEALDVFAERQKVLSETFKSTDYKNAISNVIELKDEIILAKQGFIDKDEVVKRYNETIGKTTGLVDNLDQAEKALNKNATNYIRFTYLKAAANLALEAASKKALEIEQERLKTPEQSANLFDKITAGLVDNFGSSTEFDSDSDQKFKQSIAKRGANRQKDILNQGQKDLNGLENTFKSLNKQAADLAKKGGFNFFEDNTKTTTGKTKAGKSSDDASKAEDEAQNRALADRKRYLDAILKLEEQAAKEEADLRKKNFDDSENFLSKGNSGRLLEIEKNASDELDVLSEQYTSGLIYKKEYEAKKLAIENAANLESIDSAITYAEDLIQLQKSNGKDTASEEEKLAKLQIQHSKSVRDAKIKDNDDVKASQAELNAKIKELADETANFVVSLVDAGFENRKNQLQEQINLTDETAKAEIDAVNRSLDTQVNKAAKVQLIEAQADAQKKQLQREQKKADIEKAKFDKAVAIAKVIENTAIAVSQYGFFTPFGILAAALGAVQIATLVAQPIPAYEKGTKNAKGGTSLVGEKGAEYVITPQGATFLTPNKPTLMDIPKGSTVIPHLQTARMMEVQKYAGGQAIDMSEVVRAIERNRPVKGKTIVSGWLNESKAAANYQKRRNDYFN